MLTMTTDTGTITHFGHESGQVMTIPLMILAVCAVLAGSCFGPTGMFEHHLEHTFGFEHLSVLEHHASDWLTPVVGTLVGVLGSGPELSAVRQPEPDPRSAGDTAAVRSTRRPSISSTSTSSTRSRS